MISEALRKNERIRHFMSQALDLPAFITKPGENGYFVCLCSSPRTGSTLVADILSQTGLCGVPMEYLNKDFYRAEAWFPDRSNFESYVDRVASRRTTRNGVFSLKTHFFQMRDVHADFGFSVSEWATSRSSAWIWIKRQDKVAQAVSLYRALATDKWVSNPHETTCVEPELQYNEEEIYRLHRLMLYEEARWKAFFRANGLAFLEMTYESFSNLGPSEIARELLGYLQACFGRKVIPSTEAIVRPRLAKQAATHDAFHKRFSERLRLSG